MKRMPIALVPLTLLVASIGLHQSIFASPAVSIIDLGILPRTDRSFAWDINSRGQVVGTSLADWDKAQPFLWQHGIMTQLEGPGGSVTGAVAINDRGQILGYTWSIATGIYHTVLWQDGVMIDLGTLGGSSFSAPGAINNRGQVIGWSGTMYEPHAFLWQDGVMSDLGAFGGSYSRAFALNIRGQVVGISSTGSPGGNELHAFLWQGGVMVDLGTLPGSNCEARFPCSSFAFGINARGQVVGESDVNSNERHAFLWQHGVMTDLGTLPGSPHSSALAINDRGQVAGVSYFSDAQAYHVFLWQSGVMTDLGTLGGSDSQIGQRGSPTAAINSRGQIVGVSSTASNEPHAFLWQDGAMIDLGTLPGGSMSEAVAINDHW